MRKIFTIIKTNMSGGIEQLVARGAQDVFLTGDPQVSFFRANYRRYTNFSQVRHRQIIQGNPTDGGMSSVRFERKGDLLSYTYLTLKNGTATVPNLSSLVDKVELYIGGQLIDTQEKAFNDIWQSVEANKPNQGAAQLDQSHFYPLRFFFCNNWTMSLPLVALQYHDVEIRIYWATVPAGNSVECWSNFVYLDTEEREFFASKPMEMLIKQTQKVNGSGEPQQELNFNHPVSYIAANTDNPTDGTATSTTLNFKINGSDVGDNMEITPHYNNVAAEYHSFDYSVNGPKFVLPFSLNLFTEQPTGALNFSRLDSARLITSSGVFTASTPLYAVNFNVLKIENGMGGLLFAN